MFKLMKIVFLYISFLFVLLVNTNAQEFNDQDSIPPREEKVVVPDTVPVQKSISFGINLTGPVQQLAFYHSRSDYGFSVTLSLLKKFHFTSEFGFLSINENINVKVKDVKGNDVIKCQYDYLANGQFINLGFDYNIFKKNKPGEHNMVFLGCRYGISTLKHSASNIFIVDSYWGDITNDKFPETSVNAQWFEIDGGLRVYLFKNIALGWSGRYRILTHSTNMKIVKPLIIPGYGKGSETSTWGFNYSIYYTIPFFK